MLSLSEWKTRLQGDGTPRPPRPPLVTALKAGLGGLLAIALVGFLAESTGSLLVLGSFGATCVLVFGAPDVPFSQPRHIVLGHVLSSAIGLLCLTLFGAVWWAMALAVGLTVASMMALRIVHPPAGSNPVIVFLLQPGWSFLLFPTFFGALLVCGVALLYNNLSRPTPYPKYW